MKLLLYSSVVWFQLFFFLVASGEEVPKKNEAASAVDSSDVVRHLQARAVEDKKAKFGYWGIEPDKYMGWKTHSNRLIPVYTFGTKGAGEGVDLDSYTGQNSPYRSESKVQAMYGYVPEKTVNSNAVWMDQTNIADLQRAAAASGRKYIFLVVFDGMDWQTTRAAAIWNQKKVTYCEGRGSGTHFQDYNAQGTTQFGFMVTSSHNEGSDIDVNLQTVKNPGGKIRGGYDAASGGSAPWQTPSDIGYLVGKPAEGNPHHNYTDSSSSATSMTAAIKTFNGAINVDANGIPVSTIAHELQANGWRVGAVSSVPISHATPAAAYAHNVSRDDYQDLTRDMLGLPSIQHSQTPLPGLDVVIGGGFGNMGDAKKGNESQGDNFVEGNIYLTEQDLKTIDVGNGGKYVTAVRTSERNGAQLLKSAAAAARDGNHRLLGFFGIGQYNGHLPFATADRKYNPAAGIGKAEAYSPADLDENPTLAEMTSAALDVLGHDRKPFWLMMESGDVDWANHDDNLDNSIGAVNSGSDAVKVITDWVDTHSNWDESLLIITADHGHMLNLSRPELLTPQE